MSIHNLLKSVIAIYSEVLWLYYGIALFAKTQWEIAWVNPVWWIIAALGGYSLQLLMNMTKLRTPLLTYIMNAMFLITLLFLNWRALPESAWTYALGSSIILGTIFIRSSIFVFRPPTRTQMLIRFEGNLLGYLIYALILLANPFTSQSLHLFFMLAILLSLAGMVLTLQPDDTDDEQLITHVAGQAGWFPLLVLGSLGMTVLFAGLLLIPAVRESVTSMLTAAWDGLTGAGSALLSALLWLMSLLPQPDQGQIGQLPPPGNLNPATEQGEVLYHVSLFWPVLIAAVIAGAIGLWFLGRLIRRWQPTKATAQKPKSGLSPAPWKGWWRWLARMWLRWLKYWRCRLPGSFRFPVFWEYSRVARWAKKNGLPRHSHETALQYLHRLGTIVEQLKQPDKEQRGWIKEQLNRLGNAYSAAYYSRNQAQPDEHFQPLLAALQSLKLKKERPRAKNK